MQIVCSVCVIMLLHHVITDPETSIRHNNTTEAIPGHRNLHVIIILHQAAVLTMAVVVPAVAVASTVAAVVVVAEAVVTGANH